MKNALKVIGVVVATVALIGIGYWFGTTYSIFRRMWVGNAVSQSSTKAAILSMRLHQIANGRIDDLKNHLNIELDGEILLLEGLIDWDKPDDNDKTAIKILRRIVTKRKDGNYTNDNPAVQEKLTEIYNRALAHAESVKNEKPQQSGGAYFDPAAGSKSAHP